MARRPSTKPPARDASSVGLTWSQPIHAWPVRERPRERLLLQGPAALSDAELVAVLLGNGTPGVDAVATGRALLGHAGSVGRLLASVDELSHVPGVGPVKRARLIAAMELARRSLAEGLAALPSIGSVEDCFAFLKARLAHLRHEVVGCLFLDTRHKVLGFEILAQGTIAEATVYPREVVRASLRHHASSVILVHNHPSGDPSPSPADIELTRELREALDMIEVKLLDHIVVGAGQPLSMAAMGLI
jgi:DNA repair protein RadC